MNNMRYDVFRDQGPMRSQSISDRNTLQTSKMHGIMKKATVVIPAFNEEKTIIDVIKKIPKFCEVIVVDDGSTDLTYELVKKTKKKCIRLGKNMGKGFACMAGAKNARSNIIVFIDADGQHDPKEIINLLKEIEENDIVIGKRNFSKIPIQRKISNKFARFIISLACKKVIKDALCGLRVVKKEKLFSLGLEKDGYEFESEMLIKASKKGMKIKEVPVSVNYGAYSGMPLSKSLKLAFYIIRETIK